MSLKLPARLVAAIRRHGEAGYPHEICGLLLGRFETGEVRRVDELVPLENELVDSRERRYAVSAASIFRAEKRARELALDVVGYYHSHPNAPARPSQYDLDHATWPGISYPIVSVVGGAAADLKSYCLADDRSAFVAEEIVEETA